MQDKRLPVTVLSGFLGAGTTTLLVGSDIDWSALKGKLDDGLVPSVLAAGPDALPFGMADSFPNWRRLEDAA